MKRLLSAVILLLFVFAPVSMAGVQPIVRNFSPQEYQAGTQNWQLVAAQNGWMYVANNYGLLEYDGCRWKLYGVWNSSSLHSIAQLHDGRFLAGGSNELGFFKYGTDGRLTYRSLVDSIPPMYRNFGDVWEISSLEHQENQPQTAYAQCRNLVFVCSEDGHVEVLDPASNIYESTVLRNTLYLATSSGLFAYKSHRLHLLAGSELLSGYVISAIVPFDEKSILIATDFGGLFIYDGTSIAPFHTSVDPFLSKNQLYSLSVNQQYIAFGTVLNGLVVTDRQGGSPRFFNRNNGLQNNTVLSLQFDHDGNLWAGLDQGIDLLLLEAPIQLFRNSSVDYGSGYSYAQYAGNHYYATNQGLYIQPENTDQLHLIEGSLGQVWRLCVVDKTLFCCHNRGLFEVNGSTMRQLPINDGVWRVLPIDTNKALACSYTGFYLIVNNQDQWRVAHHVNGYDETALFAELDQWGRLWTISQQGITCLTSDDQWENAFPQVVLSSPQRNKYLLSKLGNRVVVSSKGYLAVVDSMAGLTEDVKLEELLAGKHMYPILDMDRDSNLVFMYDGRLCVRVYNKERHAYQPFVHEYFHNQSFFVGGFANYNHRDDGLGVMGGVEGFYMVDGATPYGDIQKQEIIIRNASTSELGVLYGEAYSDENRSRIEMPAGNYVVHVEYATNIINRPNARFQTRLLPDEEEFGDWTSTPFVDLTMLHHGEYTLQIRSRIANAEDGYTELHFYVQRPWYVRWWAWLIYVLILAVLVYSLYAYMQYRTKLVQERTRQLQEAELQRQQMRILQLESEQTQFDLKVKSRELNSVLLNQVNRNEITSSMQQEIQNITALIENNEKESALKYLRKLDARLSAGVHHDKDWKRFEDNFDFVNSHFLSKLTTQYPWMNKQEKKLCVYIYMGLQTKEIAPLLGLSTRGVEMMRYRIRQKMGLDTQSNLRKYFENMISEDH
ncbi:MAG: hypothetical protein MJZ89_02855 [Paludibacteraceae bacterium]|nr:hypothetical protein [Paludibacteraceae bacterium]